MHKTDETQECCPVFDPALWDNMTNKKIQA
jgi:hypothetical protein